MSTHLSLFGEKSTSNRILISMGHGPIESLGHGSKKLLHNNIPVRVVLTPTKIKVGCTDVTIEALKYLILEWEKKFNPTAEEIVLQHGIN